MSGIAAGERPHVVIVGGGLAGLAAAVALAESNCRVELFEARRSLGGRAGSFRDPATGETVDHCQHVSMGCCTNLADFCRRTDTASLFRRDRRLHFIGPDGRQHRFEAGWLPAPLHLGPAFCRLRYLSIGERLSIARAMWKLMWQHPADDETSPSAGAWLRGNGQSARSIEWFWGVILVSALGEDLDRASLAAARKVIVDGFLSNRDGYVVEVPRVPLGELYGEALRRWLDDRHVAVYLNTAVRRLSCPARPVVTLDQGERRPDFAVLAVPWFRVAELVDESLASQWPWLAEIASLEASPITGVHLWFDRPIMPLDHAVLVGRMSQWVFKRAASPLGDAPDRHYYQVVISASRQLAGRQPEAIVEEVCRELAEVWPVAGEAKVRQARVVTERSAVFSARSGLDRWRPPQQTPTSGVLVAGDWTATGWPATMESAVRSGYLAAEAILRAAGQPRRFLVDDLPRGCLSRLLIKR